jgi:hypothetical protein
MGKQWWRYVYIWLMAVVKEEKMSMTGGRGAKLEEQVPEYSLGVIEG